MPNTWITEYGKKFLDSRFRGNDGKTGLSVNIILGWYRILRGSLACARPGWLKTR